MSIYLYCICSTVPHLVNCGVHFRFYRGRWNTLTVESIYRHHKKRNALEAEDIWLRSGECFCNIKRAYEILLLKWNILARPASFQERRVWNAVVMACIILHNMIIEIRRDGTRVSYLWSSGFYWKLYVYGCCKKQEMTYNDLVEKMMKNAASL